MRLLDNIAVTLGVAIFVFVVICPDIPPPKGMKDQSDPPTLHLRSVPAMLVQLITTSNVAASRSRMLTGDAIVALTCARLC